MKNPGHLGNGKANMFFQRFGVIIFRFCQNLNPLAEQGGANSKSHLSHDWSRSLWNTQAKKVSKFTAKQKKIPSESQSKKKQFLAFLQQIWTSHGLQAIQVLLNLSSFFHQFSLFCREFSLIYCRFVYSAVKFLYFAKGFLYFAMVFFILPFSLYFAVNFFYFGIVFFNSALSFFYFAFAFFILRLLSLICREFYFAVNILYFAVILIILPWFCFSCRNIYGPPQG